ncbi:pantoate--beta-alanine ligase, partial [Mycobacterium sp. Lab-001]|uniref:pantoate--beta-alanine ligase n=1 Tax=Mycobacterium sp. Lab-001 TaxID=3410136 RepID=UPI003D185B3E
QRELAGTLSAALTAGAHSATAGPAAALEAARAVLAAVPAIEVDYLELRAADLGPLGDGGPGRLLVAARLGGTRLLDNVSVELGASAGTDGPDRHVQPLWRN